MRLTRQHGLGAALLATLAATAWVAQQPDEEGTPVAAPVRRPAPAAYTAAAGASSAPPAPAASRAAWAEPEAAQLAAWMPPPPPPPPPAPPPAPPAPPPPPVAPPLPYQMIGRLVEGEGAKAVEVALLNGPNRSLSVRAGDTLDGQWRVDQVSATGVRLTWLPARLPQTLVFKPAP
ncbi:MAG: hypothetical protein DI603_08600 [Roseateles depolymerans]|uniref:General secretion pathway protein GspN n=1 Tax=Roseateles depolymerans TaxID=76731 RepID=A0A2W5DRW2_9BURK|nr:MAG: hypothetical protein DI603_08600 [Roseateles depolymerans]